MSERKKKPVQYFFVDINDPDYYKRIKVARACIDCRKRKSKCDIGKPGSGPCSNCLKHNKVCEFTTIEPSSSPKQSTVIPSSSKPTSSSVERTTIQWTEETHLQERKQPKRRRSHLVSRRLALSTQAKLEYNWTPHPLALLPFPVDSNNNNETTDNTSQSIVTQEEHHLVGHLRLNLPVLQKDHSAPLEINHATSFQWENSNSDIPNLEISMHSVSLVEPVVDLFQLYFDRVHPTFPVLPKHILTHRQHLPLCLGYAIMAVALLYQTIDRAQEYNTKAWKCMQSRGTNDLVSVQTLLVLYKYHETLSGENIVSFLHSAQAILDHYIVEEKDQEWACRLQWITYVQQLNHGVTWKESPLIRLPCLLPCELEDDDQVKAISQLLETIHMTCVYTSAIQSLGAVDSWAGQPLDDTDSSSL
ncbi:hypothetical protein BC941DRAFT_472069 [Chlamydoabsidia padenii]|nr:hypothetical protein BC941DRAFT_472069 [Chlamydoabsidia padenii]